LIAAAHGVIPWRLPHVNACGKRCGNVERVANVEAADEQCKPEHGHAHPIARHRIRNEKDAGHEQCGPEILLEKEEHQRGAHSHENGQHVVHARHVQPARNPERPELHASHLPQHLPAPCEVAGEEQREQQPDRLDRLHGAEIDLRIATARPRPEQQEHHRECEREHQRNVAERQERGTADVHERGCGKQRQADANSLYVTRNEYGVAERIGPAHQDRNAHRRQHVSGNEQRTVATEAARPPERHDRPESEYIQRVPERDPSNERL
jgi:hypothetical protein